MIAMCMSAIALCSQYLHEGQRRYVGLRCTLTKWRHTEFLGGPEPWAQTAGASRPRRARPAMPSRS